MSLRIRLMVVFTVMTSIIIGVFSIFVYYSTVSIRKNAFYDRLWERADISFQMISLQNNPDLDTIDPVFRNTFWTILPEEEIIVFNEKREFYYINEFVDFEFNYTSVLEQIRDTGFIETVIDKRQVVGLGKSVNNSIYYVIVSAADKNGDRLLSNLKITIITAYLISILFLLLAGWYFSRETFKPISRIIEIAARINETDLHLRVPLPKGRNELVVLVKTINDSFDRLQKSFEVQKSFVANASHELRTPLTSIRGELEVALLKERTADEYKQFISIAYEDSKRLSLLLNQLLLFAQTSADNRSFNFLPIRIDELIMDVIQKTRQIYPDRSIRFKFSGLVPDDNLLVISGNENLLFVCISNILDNALKYSTNGDVLLEIKVSNMLHIKIEDHGIGISQKDIQSIFEPFYRSRRSSDNVTGFGIGLPLSKQIAELHNGKLILESTLNVGTTATLTFPIKSL